MLKKLPHFLILCGILFFLNGCNKTTSTKEEKAKDNAVASRLDNEFIIHGSTFNKSLDTAYLYKVESDTLTFLDTIPVKEKSFTFKGKAEEPSFYAIKIDDSDLMYKFLVDASEIEMFLNENLFLSSTSSNSKIQKAYFDYLAKMNAFDYKERDLFLKYKSPQTPSKRSSILNTDLENLQREKINYVQSFLETHRDSKFAPFVLQENFHSFSTETLRKMHDTLSSAIQNSTSVKEINKAIVSQEEKEILLAKKTTEYRPKAYALSGPNTNGQNLSLASLNGKVVLVDFWASWCAPCRATNPNLVHLYNKYKNKGFVILSVSEDRGTSEWLSAIQVDNLYWNTHILDKSKAIAFRYGVGSIPHKFLIDKQGRIASDKISGSKLENRILELLAE